MSSGDAPPLSSPVKVADWIAVVLPSTKSSADSISNFPAVSGREAVAILPSGSPVLKKKGVAEASPTHSTDAARQIARAAPLPDGYIMETLRLRIVSDSRQQHRCRVGP